MQSKWQKTTLGEFVNINPRRSVKKGTVTPFVGMPDITENIRDIRVIGEREFGSGMKFQDGDTLFARITPCLENGKTVLVNGLGEGVIAHGSTEFIVLSPKDIEHDAKFIYYLARLPEFREFARSRMEGTSGRQRVDATALASYEFMLPPPDIRKGIGEALSAFDDKMIANSQMNQTLEKIAQRIFKSWFIDFDPVKANAEGVPFNGLSPEIQALFPSEFEESELGMIPKGWKRKTLSELGEIVTGKTPSTDVAEFYGSDIPFITIPDMHGKVFVTKSSKMLSYKGRDSQSKKTLKKGAIAVSCIATPGLTVLIHEDSQTNQQINTLTPKSCPSLFTYMTLSSMSKGSAFTNTGTVFSNMNKSSFSALKMLIATKDIMNKFDEILSPIFDKILINQKESDNLAKIRDRLLPRLITGKFLLSESNQELKETV